MTQQQTFRVPAGRVQGLAAMREQLAALNDLAAELSVTSHPEEFVQVAAAMRDLYATTRRLSNTMADTGCRWHPAGAVDPAAPEGWGNCLICNTNRGNGLASGKRKISGEMTGATARVNRPAIRVQEGLEQSPAELAQWREPEEAFRAELERAAPRLGGFRRDPIDPVYEAARARARADRAARKNPQQPR
ncbi:hypothetical protein [Streptomyces sp. NBC_01207]|uniref:hypothetical protein n=1 Tax=Streptomyces sp. NBC_01207 TaxID=2903772 RepID=UPI002E0D19D0|nr:hypothetical protein OG457_27230 [Streptomyces sp. NBC_01207]